MIHSIIYLAILLLHFVSKQCIFFMMDQVKTAEMLRVETWSNKSKTQNKI